MRTFRKAIQEEINKSGDPFMDFLEPETVVINEPNTDLDDDFMMKSNDIVVVEPGGYTAPGIPLTKDVEVEPEEKKEDKKKDKRKGSYGYLSDEQFCKLMDITDAASKSELFPAEIRQELLKFYVELVKEKSERDSDCGEED